MGPCIPASYQDNLQKKLESGSFPDHTLKSAFLREYDVSGAFGKLYDDSDNRGTVSEKKQVIDTIKSKHPQINNSNDINHLTNNSCALSYAQGIGLLGNVVVGASAAAAPVASATPVAPCSLSSSLDGQPSCKIPNINDPFSFDYN